MKKLFSLFLSLSLLPTAFAHESCPDFTFGPTGSRTGLQPYFGIESALTSFDFGGGDKGSYRSLSLKGEFALSESYGIGARLPFHFLSVENQASRSGVGDLGLSVRKKLQGDADRSLVFAGLGAEIPIGPEGKGFSSGHTELAPFLTASFRPSSLTYFGKFSGVFSLSGKHAGEESTTYVSPHADRELRYSVGAASALSDSFLLSAELAGVSALTSDPRFGGSTFYISPGLTWLSESWRTSLTPQIPFGGHSRFEWKACLGLDRLF